MLFFSTLLISMFVTMALIPILRSAAVKLHAGLDLPHPRKVHDHPVPKVGGLAMATGVLLPMVFLAEGGGVVESALLGSVLIVVFGVLDDIYDLSWKVKLAGQTLAALVVVLHGGVRICRLGSCLPEGVVLGDPVALPLTVLAIVGVTNAINLSDGLDGLAGGTSLLIFIAIGFLGYSNGGFPERPVVLALCVAMVGGIFGFLRFNTYPASVFMGDTGSQLLGFLAGTLSIGITQQQEAMSPLLPLLLLGFPVLDTLTVMTERIYAGRSPFTPDKNHFHHKLIRLGLFHTEAVVLIYAITGLLAAAAVGLRYHSEWLLIGAYAAFCAVVVSAFTAAERYGFRFHRTGWFDVQVKYRLKIFKERQVVIRACQFILENGMPLTLLAACLQPDRVPAYAGAVATGCAAAVLLARAFKPAWSAGCLRVVFYLAVPLVLRLGQIDPADWIPPAIHAATPWVFGALAVCTVLTLKFTRRRKGFRTTPLDFLIILLALVVPRLPDAAIRSVGMGAFAVEIITMFFSLEVLLGELRGGSGKLTGGFLAGMLVLGVRAVFQI